MDYFLQVDLKHTASILVDKTRDTLDSSTAHQSADSRFGDSTVIPDMLSHNTFL